MQNRSLVDIMHPPQRCSSSVKKTKKRAIRLSQQQQQQQDSSTSTDSTVSSCSNRDSEDSSGSFHSDKERNAGKAVRFSTVSVHLILSTENSTVETVDHYEIRKSAIALERLMGALKLEEYQRMASSTRKRNPQQQKENPGDRMQQPRRIRIVSRSLQSSQQSPRRRRILGRASSLSQLPLVDISDPSITGRTKSPSRRRVVTPKEEVVEENSTLHTGNRVSAPQNNSNKAPVNVDPRSAFRFLRTDSISDLRRAILSPRKKRDVP